MDYKAALYIRVSTQEQALHGISLQAQRADLEAYAKAHSMTVVGVYADEGISARKPASKRPALQRLLEDVRNGIVDTILFIKLDRWFRNIAEYYKVQEILDANHVTWRCTREEYETETAAGRLKLNVLLAVAQDEADRASERIKFVMQSKKEKNEVCTGHLPQGYKIEGKLVAIDEQKADSVRRFFQTFMESGSVREAMRQTPELGLHYRGASLMLGNEGYTGNWHGLQIPAYLTNGEFDKIQAMRRKMVRKVANNRVYLFSGIAVCAECGAKMVARPRKVKDGEHYVYQCGNYTTLAGCTNNSCFMEHKLEASILETMEDAAMRATSHGNTVDNSKQIRSINDKIMRLTDLYVDGDIDKAAYVKRRDALQAQLDALASTKEESFEPIVFSSGWKDIYANLNRDEKKLFWRTRLKEIRLTEDRRINFVFN